MRDWRDDWRTDMGLRLCGALSCGLSWLTIRSLMALRLPDGQLPQGGLPFLLAMIGFLCASAGAVLVWQGHHVFDEIALGGAGVGIEGADGTDSCRLDSPYSSAGSSHDADRQGTDSADSL